MRKNKKEKIKLNKDNLNNMDSTSKSIKLSSQDTIPFYEMFENGIVLQKNKTKNKKYNDRYSITFKIENTDYLLLKDTDKIKKQEIYLSPLSSLPTDVYYQELIINTPVDVKQIENTIVPQSLDTSTDYNLTYIKNQQNFVNQINKNNSEKKIYISLSYLPKSDTDNAENILMQTFVKISEKYAELGTKCTILTAFDKLELFHNIYHPFDYKYFQMPSDIYKKGLDIKDYISPSAFEFNNNYIQLGSCYSRLFYVRSFSESLDDEFINDLTDNNYRINISKQINLIDKAIAEKSIIDRLKNLEMDNQTRHKKNAENNTNYIPYHLKREIQACEDTLDQLQNREELFDIGIYIMISAESLEELENITKDIKGITQRHHIMLSVATFRQEECLNSILPLAYDEIKITTYLLSSAIGILIPFSYIKLFNKKGFYYGKNTVSKSPIILNRKDDKNGNGFYLGKSGSGKSMYAKMEIEDILHQTVNDKIIVIDPEGEFVNQCHKHNGTVVKISPNTVDYINPFDVSSDHNKNEDFILGKSDLILSIFEVFKDTKLTASEKSVIDRVVLLCYKDYINSNFDNSKIPTFKDFDRILLEQPQQEIANDLHLYLEMYVTGSVNIFSHTTNVDLSSNFVVFDLRDLGANLKKVGMLIILDHIWQSLLDNYSKGIYTWLYADEFHLFYSDNEDNNSSGVFFESVFARFRKYGGLATGLTQNITNVLLSPTALSMLQNAQFVILLEQATKNLNEIAELYDLSDKQKSRLLSLDKGEGILISNNIAHPFEKIYPKDNLIYETITTDFKDKIKKIKNEI